MSTTFEQCLARVVDEDGATVGTAFFVGRGGNLMVTCAHVVSLTGSGPGNEVEVVFHVGGERRRAIVLAEFWREVVAGDIAVLRLTEIASPSAEPRRPATRVPAQFGSSEPAIGRTFHTVGYPNGIDLEIVHADGKILGRTTEISSGQPLLQLTEAANIVHGFSGSPIVATSSRLVVGMTTAIASSSDGRFSDLAFAVPVESILAACPELSMSDQPPYRRLNAFREEDAEWFFGRDDEVRRLARALSRDSRLLVVFGPSGSGKSSLIHAGLVPHLRRLGEEFQVITVRPADASALLHDRRPEGLPDARSAHPRRFIVIDQFEEVFTGLDEHGLRHLIAALAAFVERAESDTVILTVRDEFFGQLSAAAPPDLRPVLDDAIRSVSGALSPEALAEIIERPAARAGLTFEPGLVERVVADALTRTPSGDREAAVTVLPLLEFALSRLWDHRTEGRMTHQSYTDLGGVGSGLARWADRSMNRLTGEHLEVARIVLTALVRLGDESAGVPDTARRVPWTVLQQLDFPPRAVRKVIGLLTDARLIVSSRNTDAGESEVALVHEVLLREWSRLRGWIAADRRFLSLRQDLDHYARRWTEDESDPAFLLRGALLDAATNLSAREARELNDLQRTFIAASAAAWNEQMERERHLRRQAETMRERSDQLLAHSEVLRLAAQAEIVTGKSDGDLDLALAFGTESQRREPTLEGDAAIRHALQLAPRRIFRLGAVDVRAAVMSADGRRIALGLGSQTIIVYDVIDESATARIDGPSQESGRYAHEAGWRDVGFSPDGTVLAVAWNDGSCTLHTIRSDGADERRIPTTGARKVRFDSSSALLAVADAEGFQVIQVHEMRRSRTVRPVRVSCQTPTALVFSLDGRRLLTGHTEYMLVVAPESGGVIHRIDTGREVKSISITPDRARAVALCRSSLFVVDLAAGGRTTLLPLASDYGEVVIDPGGTKALLLPGGIEAHVIELNGGSIVMRLRHRFDLSRARSGVYSPDGETLFVGWGGTGMGDGFTAFDTRTGQQVKRSGYNTGGEFIQLEGPLLLCASQMAASVYDLRAGAEQVVVRHEKALLEALLGPTFLATAAEDGSAHIVDVTDGEDIEIIRHAGSVRALAVSTTGRFVATGGDDGNIKLFDVHDRRTRVLCDLPEEPHDAWEGRYWSDRPAVTTVAIAPPDTELAMASDEGFVRRYRLPDGALLEEFKLPKRNATVAYSPDGRRLAVAVHDELPILRDVESGRLINLLVDNLRTTYFACRGNVAFSPDGHLVAFGGGTRVAIFPTDGGAPTLLDASGGVVWATEFSPDSTRIAVAGGGNTCQILEVRSGTAVLELRHDFTTPHATFSRDGRFIATASGDRAAHIYDATTGTELVRLDHPFGVNRVRFNADGSRLATACDDGVARVWNVAPELLLDQAEKRMARKVSRDEWEQSLRGIPYPFSG